MTKLVMNVSVVTGPDQKLQKNEWREEQLEFIVGNNKNLYSQRKEDEEE